MIVQIVLVIVTAVQVNSQQLCPSVCQCYSEQANYTVLVVCFLMGNSSASEFCMQTFRNTLSVPSSYQSMKMEQTGCSETKEYKIQTPRNYPEESIQHSEHGENLKSRIYIGIVSDVQLWRNTHSILGYGYYGSLEVRILSWKKISSCAGTPHRW